MNTSYGLYNRNALCTCINVMRVLYSIVCVTSLREKGFFKYNTLQQGCPDFGPRAKFGSLQKNGSLKGEIIALNLALWL